MTSGGYALIAMMKKRIDSRMNATALIYFLSAAKTRKTIAD